MAEQTLTTGMDLPAVAAAAATGPARRSTCKYQPGFGTIAICCLVMLYVPILVLVDLLLHRRRFRDALGRIRHQVVCDRDRRTKGSITRP